MTTTPKPGMIGLTQITGDVGAGIRLGQWLNGEGFADWEHAFVYLGAGQILEAEPGGSRIVPLNYAKVYWCEGIYKLLPTSHPADLAAIGVVGQSLKGIPYSFLDYAYLAAHRLHIPVPGLQHKIEDDGHMICSQLADEFYWRLNAHIFTDDRWPGYVTPASLYNRDIQLR